MKDSIFHEVRAVRFQRTGSNGMTLRGLRQDAQITASGYGPKMTKFNADGVAQCMICNDLMQVDGANEPPLGIHLGGQALERECQVMRPA